MFYQLPPAGNTISLDARSAAGLLPAGILHPWQPEYFNSGTAALAAAVMAAVSFKDVRDPEVILPAYGCPDLVSAVLYAGARPVLVDFEMQRPWMDLDQLASSVGENTVAIVAVDLFGIPERMDAIRVIARQSAAILIEDSAQAFPGENAAMENFWGGDLVVTSFGRGKPVTLLGGGAVLCREEKFRKRLPCVVPAPAASLLQRLGLRSKALLYNFMSSARIYWIPAWLPMLHLGETRFHSLDEVRSMDAARLELLEANIAAYRLRSLHVQSELADRVSALAARSDSLIDLPAVCKLSPARALLRYPVLVDPAQRESIYQCLDGSGLGVSRMYPVALPDIPGLAHQSGMAGAFPAARDFAARVLTLPVHERVRAADRLAIADCIEFALG
jgi:dTDP-4-amino-4,6-dideoxygalactose transaminase